MFFIGLLAFLFLKAFRNPRSTPSEDSESKQTRLTPNQTDRLIQRKLRSLGFSPRMSRNWAAISRSETGDFTNGLTKDHNNIFSMKQPRIRNTTSLGETEQEYDTGRSRGKFASFSSRESAIDDLVLYMQEFNYPRDFPNLFDHLAFMKSKGYYGVSFDTYLARVRNFEPSVVFV